jgi:RHS repeat-associated protein
LRPLFQCRNSLFGLASKVGRFRNGTTHTYSYDTLSRPTSDAVTTLGSGVDGTVRRITTGYSPLGTSYLFTSYDAASGGNVVNQVKDEFNGLGQITKEWQEHSGAVTGTSANVQYGYSEMAGGANHSRLTSITYASGYVLNYNYGSGLDSTISRLTSLSDSGNSLESYSYLGLATVVKRAHAQSGVDLSYIKLTGESVGDAGDQYTGLDRFQRIVDQRWINGSNVDVDRFKYGYDRNGNRLFRENVAIASLSEVYTYDDLNQLASYKLGTLNTGKTDVTGTPTNAQSWDYDAVGNWDSVTTNSTTQTRGANRQNEITSVSGATTPTYDNNGNLTKDENDNRFVWDAWNMLVQVKNSSNVVIVTYGRDALHRHVTDTVGSSVTDRFFSQEWQLLETKAGSNTVTRNVWSPAYVDGLVTRDRDTDSNGTLDERLYSLQDANWNTTGLVNTSGTVVERDTYSPFGVVTFRDASGAVIGSSAKDWVFLHQGGEKIAAGDYEFRNRVVSPTLGRWLSNDPIGFSAGDVNTYRALTNNPILQVDPTGEIPPLLILGGMALGWLLFDPPPAQAPTQPGETVVPPPNPGEKAIGVALGAGVGLIAVGVGEIGIGVIVGITKIIRKVPSTAPKTAFQVAQEGGRHAGFLKNYIGRSPGEIRRAINSIRKEIAEHYDKIANPEKYYPGFKQLDPRQQAALINKTWPSDIARQKEHIEILEGLLK